MTPQEKYTEITSNVKKLLNSDLPPEAVKVYLKSEGLTLEDFAGILEGPTVLGQTGEFFKGIIPGAAGLVETAATGIGAAFDDETEQAIRESVGGVTESIREKFTPTPGYEETVGRKFGEAFGSFIPFLAFAPFGVVGKAAVRSLAIGAGAGEARLRAEEAEATEDQRALATGFGAPIGLLELFAPARILKKLDTSVIESGVQRVGRALETGGVEAATEAAAGYAQNAIAKGVYKPEQELVEGIGEEAAYGGAVGALAQGLFDLAVPRARKIDPVEPPERPIEEGAQIPLSGLPQPTQEEKETADLAKAAEKRVKGISIEEETTQEEARAYIIEAEQDLARFERNKNDLVERQKIVAPQERSQIEAQIKQIENYTKNLKKVVEDKKKLLPESERKKDFIPSIPVPEGQLSLFDEKGEVATNTVDQKNITSFTQKFSKKFKKQIEKTDFEVPSFKERVEDADNRKKSKVKPKVKNTDTVTFDFLKNQVGLSRPSIFINQNPNLEGKFITDPIFLDALDTYARKTKSVKNATAIENFLANTEAKSKVEKPVVEPETAIPEEQINLFDPNTFVEALNIAKQAGKPGVFTTSEQRKLLSETVKNATPEQKNVLLREYYTDRDRDVTNKGDDLIDPVVKRKNFKINTLEDLVRYYEKNPNFVKFTTSGGFRTVVPKITKEHNKESRQIKLDENNIDTIEKGTILENNTALNKFQPYVERLSAPVGATPELKAELKREYEESKTKEQKEFDSYVKKFVDQDGIYNIGEQKRKLRLLAGDLLRPQKRAVGDAKKVYNKLNKSQKRYVDNSIKEIQGQFDFVKGPVKKLGITRIEIINAELDLKDINKELKNNPNDIELQGEKVAVLEDIKELNKIYNDLKKEIKKVSPTKEEAIKFIEKVENVRIISKPVGKKAERKPKKETLAIEVTEVPELVKKMEGFVKELTKGWKNAPKIQVVNGFPDLIKITEQDMAVGGIDRIVEGMYSLEKLNRLSPEQQRNIKGIFDSNTETVYVIAANNTDKRDLLKTILHESVGHYGLRSILGKDYKTTMNELYETDGQIKYAADQLIREQGLSKEEAVEELIAVAVENAFVGRRPEAEQERFMAALQKLVRETLKAIKRSMQNLGFPVLNNTEVQDIIAQSADYVIHNKVAESREATVGTETGAERFMFRDASVMANDTLANKFLDMNVSNSKGPTPGFFSKISSAFFESPNFFKRKALEFETQVAYKGASVERKIREVYNNETRDSLGDIRPDILMLQTEHADSLATAVMRLGRLVFNKVSGFEATQGDASLTGVFEKVGRLGEQLGDIKKAEKLVNDALIVIRAKDLKGKDIIPDEFLPTKEQIEAGEKVLEAYPIIENIHEEFTSFKNGLLDNMVDSGRLGKDKAEKWKKAIGYVPWNRIKESEVEVFSESPAKFFKQLSTRELGKFTGSKDEINSVLENMVGLTFWMVKSSVRNHAALSIVDNWVKYDLGIEKLKNRPDKDYDTVATVYRDGNAEFYAFKDPLDAYAFRGLEIVSGPIIKAMTCLSDLLRKGVTATPQFAISQLFQDSYRAMTLSGTDNPFKTAARVINPLSYGSVRLGKNETVAQLKRYGIVGAYDFMPGREKDEVLTAFNLRQKGRTRKFLEFFEDFSIASDANLRRAVFEQTLEETKSEQFPDGDVLKARIAAQEIINFKRQGANKYVSVLRQVVPFMNAYIQGMSVFLRTMQGRGVSQKEKYMAQRLFLKAGYKLATLSVIYTLLVGGEEEYQGQDEYIKDKNFIIPGTDVKLPVAPEIGFLFKVLPERTINYVISQGTARPEDAQTFRENIGLAAFNAFSGPNLTPQAFKAPAEVFLNYSFFRDAPIVPRGLEYVAAREQFTSSTSELAKLFGQFTGISPIKSEYLFRGMTGIAGGTVLDLTNVISSKVMGRREYNLYELPAFKTFTYDKIPSGDKTEYYKFRDEIARVTDTVNLLINRQDAEALIKYLEEDENAKLFILGQSVRAVQQQLSQTRALKRVVNGDASISARDKTELTNMFDKLDNDMIQIINVPYIKKNILDR